MQALLMQLKYVKNTIVTFEKYEVSSSDMKSRISGITTKLPWIVFLEEGKIVAYAYASEWKSRCAYKNSVETTVYLESNATGKGIGTKLYQENRKANEIRYACCNWWYCSAQ